MMKSFLTLLLINGAYFIIKYHKFNMQKIKKKEKYIKIYFNI